MSGKPKLAMYWAAACGGCEIALVNVNEKILDLADHFDFVFCPCLLDTKKADVEAMEDGSIDVCLFNGSIRTTENEEMAHLLRRKSKLLVAFGSCASEGCVPGLANLSSSASLLNVVYSQAPTADALGHQGPPTNKFDVPEGTIELPALRSRVSTLDQVTDVDFFFPGCPPEPKQISAVLDILIQGKALPPKKSSIGCGDTALCEECPRTRTEKRVTRFYRTHEIIPNTDQCLLEQGLICMGVATRSGCGALCMNANMPCIGCYGAPPGVTDQGAKMLAALGSTVDIGDTTGLSEDEIAARIRQVVDTIPDMSGTVYKFSLATSLMGGGQG